MNNTKIDYNNIDLQDSKTWDLICSGNVTGCFQIESALGKRICKLAKPRSISELSDVVAIMRPGTLEAKLEDGKSVTDHYIKRKNGEESVEYFHPKLEPILKDTYGLLIYQEQMIRMASELAGFSEHESDSLRRAVGKKKVELMHELSKKFVEGCVNNGISTESSRQIFEWIEKSQRYSFNQSHSVSYAYVTYWTAYTKANKPVEFSRSYLSHSEDKQKPLDEIATVVRDCRQNKIEVLIPDIRERNLDFKIVGERQILFGLSHIKSLGNSAKSIVDGLPKNIRNMQWPELLFKCLLNTTKKSAIKVLLSVGAFDFLCLSRKKMLYEHDMCIGLKEHEIKYILDNCLYKNDVPHAVQDLVSSSENKKGPISNGRRLETVKGILSSLKTPAMTLKDTVEEISKWEESYLGIGITCSRFSNIKLNVGDKTCKEFDRAEQSSNVKIIGQVSRINSFKDKNDNDMAFISIVDDIGEISSVVVFSAAWAEYSGILQEKNVLRFWGRKDGDSFLLSKCEEVK